MSERNEFEAIVIGAGQAGPGIAAAKAQQGKRTALIELDRVGGTCLNHGCKPTKALRASAVIARHVQRGPEYGVHVDGTVRIEFGEAIRRVHTMIDTMRRSLQDWLDGVDGLEQFAGVARLETVPGGPHLVHLDTQTLSAPEVYLDLGGRAAVPPIPGLSEVDFLTEVELLNLSDLPEHLVIVGGGYIGCEFAQIFRRFGSTVTIFAGERVAAREDADISELVAGILTDEGIRIVPGRTSSVAAHADGVAVTAGEETVVGSHVLVATGRTSNVDLLGDAHGLAVNARGFIEIDDRFATSVPGVWALGDVNGHGAFTHTAYQDSQILLEPSRSLAGRVTTYAMFTDPPLGRVGMTVAEARTSGRRVLKAEVPMSSVSRAILDGETEGVMRILVDADSEEIIGATILGLHGDDLIQILSFAMQAGVRYPQIRDALPIHPTMAEFIPSILGSLQPL
ncbi:mercuric reductase [Microlunatus ginsengisoli]|uniref:FAD-containing oxidoreductase n=1 Tax=Microlunatus ginsengisoli TaxID=363863 RepID=A0ABP7AHS4_9ACTN